ncbi:MAG: heme ABC exporter ATP-binding protein CcmA [Chloroflexota bacterium]
MGVEALIEVRALTKRFGLHTALDEITLSVEQGETAALVGPNGAGKTTLLRVLATLSRPSSGSVMVAGHGLPSEGQAARRRIGFVSHQTLLYDDLTATQNLRFYARMYDLQPAADRIDTLVELVGLRLRQDDLVRTYSRGMKQRLAVARAVLHQPDLLLLDEPFTGLDPEGVETLRYLLGELSVDGCTILLATHRLGRALAMSDRVLVLHQGRVTYDQRCQAMQTSTFADTYRAFTT